MGIAVSSKKQNEFFELFVYIVGAVFLVYFVPAPVNKFLFLAVLPIAWKSKKDYFWLAFFLILIDQPGGLFSGGKRDDAFRLPIYTILLGFAFTIYELYLILFLLKIKLKSEYRLNKKPVFFAQELNTLVLLFILLVSISPFIGMSFKAVNEVIKIVINLTLFYSMFYIIPDLDKLIRFLKLIFPFAFIAVILQVFSLANGFQIVHLVKPNIEITQGVFNVFGEGEIERPIELVSILFICFSGSLLMIRLKTKAFNINYLWTINLISFVSIFMTGTRSWFLAFVIGYIVFLFLSRNEISKILYRSLVGIFIVICVSFYIPSISRQIEAAATRIVTINKVIEGDFTAGGTLLRIDQRAPKVMAAFNQSTWVFGAAFSDLHREHQDFHVGYHNLLLNVGVIGVLAFLFLFLRIIIKGIFVNVNDKHKLTSTALIGLIILFVINTGSQTIGFNVVYDTRFFIQAYVLVVISIIYRYTSTQNRKLA